jgi:hypothetical protein
MAPYQHRAGGKSANVAVSSSLTPFTFNLAAGTTAADQQLIRDAVLQAQTYFVAALGQNFQAAARISSAIADPGCDTRTGNLAFSAKGAVTVCVGQTSWTRSAVVQRQRAVIHELFHALQYEMEWLGNAATAGPDWIIEGSAELMAYRAIDAKGLLTLATARGCQVKQLADFTASDGPLPQLLQLESHQAFVATLGPVVAHSFLGVDQLTAGAGIASLRTYAQALAAGNAWPVAFQKAFNTQTNVFYNQFPTYESALTVPAKYLCDV